MSFIGVPWQEELCLGGKKFRGSRMGRWIGFLLMLLQISDWGVNVHYHFKTKRVPGRRASSYF